MPRQVNLLDFSDDVLRKILQFCNSRSKLAALPLVCKRFDRLLKDPVEDVWGPLCISITEGRKEVEIKLLVADDDGKHVCSYADGKFPLLHWILARARGFNQLHLNIPTSYPSGVSPPGVWQVLAGCFPLTMAGLHVKTLTLEFYRAKTSVVLDAATTQNLKLLAQKFGRLLGESSAGLQQLSFANCSAPYILDSLLVEHRYTALKHLTLHFCNFRSGHEGTAVLPYLTHMKIMESDIYRAKFECNSLVELEVTSCDVGKEFVEWIGHLTSLRSLTLSVAFCEGAIVSDRVLEHWHEVLPNLKALSLMDLELTTLPPTFSRCTSLEDLHLSNNKFTTLPSCVAHMTALRNFGMSCNRLATIPLHLSSLTQLTRLSLANQQHGGRFCIPHPLDDLLVLTRLRVLLLPDLKNDTQPCWSAEQCSHVVSTAYHLGRFVLNLRQQYKALGKHPPKIRHPR